LESKNRKISFLISENDTGIYNAKLQSKFNGEVLLFLNSGDVLNGGLYVTANFINFSEF
jgi:hypothetical protein